MGRREWDLDTLPILVPGRQLGDCRLWEDRAGPGRAQMSGIREPSQGSADLAVQGEASGLQLRGPLNPADKSKDRSRRPRTRAGHARSCSHTTHRAHMHILTQAESPGRHMSHKHTEHAQVQKHTHTEAQMCASHIDTGTHIHTEAQMCVHGHIFRHRRRHTLMQPHTQ